MEEKQGTEQAQRQIVSLSGGRDSTAMLLLMLEKGEQLDDIVFFDWGLEFPQIYEHLEKIEQYISRPITRIYLPHSFDWYLFDMPRRNGNRGYGWANGKARWCSRYKADWINQQYRNSLMCIGYEFTERRTRPRWDGTRWQHNYNITPRYPLLEWGVHKVEALSYCESHGFDFGGLYRIFTRTSCWCCPLQSIKDLKALKVNFPALWEKMLDMDRRSPYPFPRGVKLEEL